MSYNNEDGEPNPKRRRTNIKDDNYAHHDTRRTQTAPNDPAHRVSAARCLRYRDYTVGWICALPREMAAAQAMLDEIHETLPNRPRDTNTYTLGRIGMHNVVIACLPAGHYGLNNAAAVGSNMVRSFPHIEKRFMVGIGGGVPDLAADVRLGDVVVGDEVIQYDFGKAMPDNRFYRTSNPVRPPPDLMTAVSKLRATHDMRPSRMSGILDDMLRRNPRMRNYARPRAPDHLYQHTYAHAPLSGATDGCQACDKSMLVAREARQSDGSVIHYGKIASGNLVIKSGETRMSIASELDILCFEMEAAGLMDGPSCLVIRGICDYSDSHKNKIWQDYAAAVAAAYTKELLLITPSNALPVDHNETRGVIGKGESQATRKTIMKSLWFDAIDSRFDTVAPAMSKTCEWFLESQIYSQWLDPNYYQSHHGFLWISGVPGAGKTTLMKFVCSRMQTACKSDPNTAVIAFFFNARGADLEKTTTGMYRSLLYHTVEAFPKLSEQMPTLSDEREWSLARLQDSFRAVIENLRHWSVTYFVDGLDECNEAQVVAMIELFEDLGEAAYQNSSKFYVCLSSRHYPHVKIQSCLRIVLEDNIGHSHDIEKYVHRKLAKAASGQAVAGLMHLIIVKAAGVFMWVVLVIDLLRDAFNRGDVLLIQQQVQKLPSELGDLYKMLICRDNRHKDQLLLCVQWILFAQRPLTREEYFFAMHSGLHQRPETLMPWDPNSVTPEQMGLFVNSSSKGLAVLTTSETSPTVQFMHQSVRDYFLTDDGIRTLWPELSKLENFRALSHDRLRACCEFYLGTDVFTNGLLLAPMTASRQRSVLNPSVSPFFNYAAAFVFHHANACATRVPQEGFLRRLNFSSWLRIHMLIPCEKPERHWAHRSSMSLLYWLVENNWVELVRLAVAEGPVAEQPPTALHPLSVAAANGFWDAAKLLIAAEGMNLQPLDSVWRTPLIWAVIKDRPDVVEMLLATNREGCHIRDWLGDTAMGYATRSRNPRMRRLFADRRSRDLLTRDPSTEPSREPPVSWITFPSYSASNAQRAGLRGASSSW